MSRLAKHDLGACGAAAGRVCCQILRPHVGLGFDDAPDAERASVVVHEVHADEITGNGERARGVEVTRKFASSGHGPASYADVVLLRNCRVGVGDADVVLHALHTVNRADILFGQFGFSRCRRHSGQRDVALVDLDAEVARLTLLSLISAALARADMVVSSTYCPAVSS